MRMSEYVPNRDRLPQWASSREPQSEDEVRLHHPAVLLGEVPHQQAAAWAVLLSLQPIRRRY